MKKRISALLAAVILLLSLCACGEKDLPSGEQDTDIKSEQDYEKKPLPTPDQHKPSVPDPTPDKEETPDPAPETPDPEPEEPEIPLGVTSEIIGTTLYVRGRGPMDDYTSSPFKSDGITEVVIEEGVTSVGAYAFNKINGLVKVTLPESLEKIGTSAFVLTPIQEIDFPSKLTYIGTSAFSHCENLTVITGGENLEHVGGSAFYNVPYVEDYPEDTLIMGHCFLKYKGNDSEVVIPEGITCISSEAFKSCRTLTSVIIPEGVQEIGNSAFCECTGLTSVHIPDSVHTINGGAFAKCSALETVTGGNGLLYVGGDIFLSTRWSGQDSNGFVIFGTALLDYRGNLREIVVPDGVKAIAAAVFQMEDHSTSIYLPDGLVSIEFQAFHQCKADSVSIPASVEYIDNHVFLGSRIKTITFRGTEDQWNNIQGVNGEPYVLESYALESITVEFTG